MAFETDGHQLWVRMNMNRSGFKLTYHATPNLLGLHMVQVLTQHDDISCFHVSGITSAGQKVYKGTERLGAGRHYRKQNSSLIPDPQNC